MQTYPTTAQPLVYGQWLHANGAPTVLIYGHYDVQPVDPLDLWSNAPFDAKLVNGEFLGRGISDDKGGLLQPVQAVEALLKSGGKLPVNIKVCKRLTAKADRQLVSTICTVVWNDTLSGYILLSSVYISGKCLKLCKSKSFCMLRHNRAAST